MPQTSIKPEQNRMGTMPVNRLLISMSLPMIISMLVQAMYNIIDSIFVSRINEAALAAISMAFPIQSLMIAVSSGTCVGVNALLSRSLGEQNPKEAQKAAQNGIFLAVLGALAFALFGFFASRLYFASQTDDPEIIEYGVQYLQICLIFSIGFYMEMMLERIMQSTGRTIYNMFSQGLGAITNIILDPIMIFGLFGFPALGIRGAAIATVTGQFLAMFISLFCNIRWNPDVSIRMKGFAPDKRIIGIIYAVGLPSIVMQSIASVMTYGMNKILGIFSSTAVTVFGVYFKLQSFIFMPVFGLNNGMVPIIAYNYGAGSRSRVVKTIKLGVMYSVCIMLLGVLIMQCLPEKLLLLFEASDTMLSIGIPALRIISIHFALAGFCIVMSTAFQSLGYAWCSMINSICRQVVVILPAAWLLSLSGRLELIWWSFPIAEFVSAALQVSFLVLVCKKVIMHIGEDQEN